MPGCIIEKTPNTSMAGDQKFNNLKICPITQKYVSFIHSYFNKNYKIYYVDICSW